MGISGFPAPDGCVFFQISGVLRGCLKAFIADEGVFFRRSCVSVFVCRFSTADGVFWQVSGVV